MKFAGETVSAPKHFTMLPASILAENCVFVGINETYEEIKRMEAQVLRL